MYFKIENLYVLNPVNLCGLNFGVFVLLWVCGFFFFFTFLVVFQRPKKAVS